MSSFEDKKAEILSLMPSKPTDTYGVDRDAVLEYEAVEKKLRDLTETNIEEILNKPITKESDVFWQTRYRLKNYYGVDIPPLMWAIRKNNARMVELLLDIGADPNLKLQPREEGYTPTIFSYTTNVGLQTRDFPSNALKISNSLLKHGAHFGYSDFKDSIAYLSGILYHDIKANEKTEFKEFFDNVLSKGKKVLTPEQQSERLYTYTRDNPDNRMYARYEIIVREMMKHGFDINQPITVEKWDPVKNKYFKVKESVYESAHPVMKKKVLDEFVRKDYEKAVAESAIGKKLPDVLTPLITDYLVPRPKKAGTRKRFKRKQNNRKRLTTTKRHKH